MYVMLYSVYTYIILKKVTKKISKQFTISQRCNFLALAAPSKHFFILTISMHSISFKSWYYKIGQIAIINNDNKKYK